MIRWLLPLASAALAAAPVNAQGEGGGHSAAPPAAANLQAALALAAMKHALPPTQKDYGPFRVIASDRVEMVGATDRATPGQFAAMLRDHPRIRRIDMVECPGTHDDRANLTLGRMIRAAGLATHVPANGSVRSGAVDLFLAGRERVIHNGAEFAVHSWRDSQGREAGDFAPDAAPNRNYLAYYREMGMDAGGARAFYAFTNSVPHREALWLEAWEMRAWAARVFDRPRRPVLASAAAGNPVVVTHIAALDPPIGFEVQRMALLDVSMLDRTALARRHRVIGMLDSTRRL